VSRNCKLDREFLFAEPVTGTSLGAVVDAELKSLGFMNTHGKWRDLNSSIPFHPWVKAFNDTIRISPLPHLGGREIIIVTDSSGLHRENPFEVLGLLILDFDSSVEWEVLRQTIRRNILKDSRRMSFKQLNEPVRQRALIPFLRAADQINGLCLACRQYSNAQTHFACF
jgi:hypothetical protein